MGLKRLKDLFSVSSLMLVNSVLCSLCNVDVTDKRGRRELLGGRSAEDEKGNRNQRLTRGNKTPEELQHTVPVAKEPPNNRQSGELESLHAGCTR